MKTTKLLKCCTLITFTLMVVMNAVANILPFNGLSTKAVSDYYQNLFTPSAYTFSIWSLIYILLILAIAKTIRLKEFDPSEHRINLLFSLSSILNGVWMLSWHYFQIEISLIIMTALFITLALINRLTHSQNNFIQKTAFSVYFGWITIALVANCAALLSHYQFNLFNLGQPLWTALTIVIVTLIACYATYQMKDAAYGAVVLWSLFGIVLKHTSLYDYNSQYPLIIFTLIASLIVVGSLELYLFKNMYYKRSH